MKKKTPTPNDWLAVLAAAGKKTPDIIPPGYKTIEQIAAETGKSVTMTRLNIKQARTLGLIEELKLKVGGGEGKLYPTTHYRIV